MFINNYIVRCTITYLHSMTTFEFFSTVFAVAPVTLGRTENMNTMIGIRLLIFRETVTNMIAYISFQYFIQLIAVHCWFQATGLVKRFHHLCAHSSLYRHHFLMEIFWFSYLLSHLLIPGWEGTITVIHYHIDIY